MIENKLGRKVVERVRESPRRVRKAMTKMTSPVKTKKQKEEEIYIVTLQVVHNSGFVIRSDVRSDAWQGKLVAYCDS